MSTLRDALVPSLYRWDDDTMLGTPEALADAMLTDPRMAAIAEVVEAAEAWEACSERVGSDMSGDDWAIVADTADRLRAAVAKLHALKDTTDV